MESELRFCTECGAENPTLAPTTLVTPRAGAAQGSGMAPPASSLRAHNYQQSQGTSNRSQASYPDHISRAAYAEASAPQKRSPLTLIALIAGAAVLLLVGGIASRFLFDNNHKDNNPTTTQTPAPANDVTPTSEQRATQTQSQPLPRPTERALPQPTEPPLLDNRALTREVEDTLNGWAAAARGHDLDAQMSYYADSLDTYFRRQNVSAAYVRSTREAAFTRYTTLDIQLGVISVEFNPSGTIATATFDKTYRFEGDKILSGSVRQVLSLTKIAGRWRITGERDIHVYYTNSKAR
jgi:ketosteroid isomerase-like protein